MRQFAKSGGLIAACAYRTVGDDELAEAEFGVAAHRIHDLIRVVRPFFTANMQVLGIGRLALLAAVHPTHVTGITTNGT